jgi:hypothetical protein
MPCTLQIESISGNSPYTIYVCDYIFYKCELIGIYTEPLTYPFYIPVPANMEGSSKIIVRIDDASGCTKFNLYNAQTPITPLT